MTFFRKRLVLVSYTLLGIFLYELVFPTAAYALTGGPSQPEVQSFTPVGVSDMVDVFSGDFKYNIPLLEVDGYPVNISYSAGVNVDQEASWVGLGWNLNPGAIDRSMRGLPDEFDGDVIEKEEGMKDKISVGLAVGKNWEIFGKKKENNVTVPDSSLSLTQSFKIGVLYNNYTGFGLDLDYSISGSKTITKAISPTLGAGLSIGYSGESGLNMQPSVNLSVSRAAKKNEDNSQNLGIHTSAAYNSRSGMKTLNFGWSATNKWKTDKNGRAQQKGSLGGNGSMIDYGFQSWTPSISTPMKSFSMSLSVAIGKEIMGGTKNWNFPVDFSIQKIRDNQTKTAAYGYLKHENAGRDGLQDFNREKDQPFSELHTNLPVPIHTPDVFSVSAQGIGGSFRLHRNDQLNYYEGYTQDKSNRLGVGFDIASLKTFKVGLNFSFNNSKTETGNWYTGNKLQEKHKAIGKSELPNNPDYEPAYFRQMGEHVVSNAEKNRALNGYSLIIPAVSLGGTAGTYIVSNSKNDPIAGRRLASRTNPLSAGGSADYTALDNIQKERQPRNILLSGLKAELGYHGALTRTIELYNINSLNRADDRLYPDYGISRNGAHRLGHHYTEMNITSTDGQRYVFGLPAYNLTQSEMTFAVSPTGNCTTGLVSYDTSDTHYDKNKKGRDWYVSKTVTPGYAYAYHLTAILSPDYVDLTHDGVSDDDLGTATKFNYSKPVNEYNWRVPYDRLKANYQVGKLTDLLDDKGSVVYGKKEIHYLHSIEGKNHVAMFFISQREDALGVVDQHGGQNLSVRQYKLDSIVLYNKQDYVQNGLNAYKIKAVHFTYSYDLVNGVPNHNASSGLTFKGKLTLKQIYFTYGNSFKGKLSPYKFNYNQEASTSYSYHLKAADRWGTYKDPGATGCGDVSGLNSVEFPFTEQDKSTLDINAGLWSLSEIILPSGGKIQVEYESDDYAYVQDRKAMTMYKIQGFGLDDNFTNRSNQLFWLWPDKKDVEYIFIDLGGVTTENELYRIVQDIHELQVNMFADINGKGRREFVKGYVDFNLSGTNNFGLCNGNTSAYLRIGSVKMRDKGGMNVNPLSKMIWNWAKMNTPDLVYNTSVKANPGEGAQVGKFFYEFVGLFNEMRNLIMGINNALRTRRFGQIVITGKSWVRLKSKNNIKLGGGHRVKSISINDNWSVLGAMNTNADDAEYGQQYEYTTNEVGDDGIERIISSGVAAYEPMIGSDENPWHMPAFRTEKRRLAQDIRYMDDVPYGESFMPGASVGYSKVVVKNLDHQGVSRTATGKQEYQFYTAKDFPSKVTCSELAIKSKKPNFASRLFNWDRVSKTEVSAGQGYLIELNDMHGKPKAEYTYSNTSTEPIGGVEYTYQTNPNNNKELLNTVQVVSSNGAIQDKDIATEVEVYNDFRNSQAHVVNAGMDFNIDFFNVSILLFLIPSLYGSYKEEFNRVQTAVTVKLVNRYGIVSKTTAIKEGSRIETKNLLYDELTGEVLVSSVQNEFEDNIYSSKTPAHWAYDGMGPAYKNTDIVLQGVYLDADSILLPNGLNVRNYLVPGDLLYLKGQGFPPLLAQVYEGTDYKLNVIDAYNGNKVIKNTGNPITMTVIRSGRRNLQNVPIQQISAHHYSTSGDVLALDSVISTSAVEFDEYWPFYCDKTLNIVCDTTKLIDEENLRFFLNQVIAYNGIHHLNKNVPYSSDTCLISRIENIGYATNDTLYAWDEVNLEYVPNDELYCYKCVDSIYVSQEGQFFTAIPISEVDACLNTCSDGQTILASNFVPENAFYSDIRYLKDSLGDPEAFCEDTNVKVTVYNKLSSQDDFNNDLSIDYRQCDFNCSMTLNLPTEYCFDSIVDFSEITYADNQTLNVETVTRLFDGTLDTNVFLMTSTCETELLKINCHTECATPTTETQMNPYRYGILGNWRMKRNHAYVGERNYSNQTRTRTDGTFKTFAPYYTYNMAGGMNKSSSANWVWASEVTKYTPFGNEIENKDALGRYSAAVFGFNYTLPTAVAGNSKQKQIAFAGFEENNLFWNKANCFAYHFSEDPFSGTQGEYSTEYSHSGNYSLKVNSGQSITANIELSECLNENVLDDYNAVWNNSNCVGIFNPDTGKYILSVWVKEGESFTDTSYKDLKMRVKLHKTGAVITTTDFLPDGPIIDGWQRVFVSFQIDPTVEKVEFEFIAPSGVAAWFDDFRVHPFNSNMKTYAYDQITLRLMAELDDNNFATYYEYDKEGALIRVKKETIKGIKTLKEVRKQIVKQP